MAVWIDLDYFRRRAREERAVATLAVVQPARAAHEQLALRYELIVYRQEQPPSD
jgi:hypothetical protein